VSTRKSKVPAAPRVLEPIRGCQFCGGTGWVKQLTGIVITRNIPGLKPELEGRPPVERCRCTSPEARGMGMIAPPSPPAGMDSAQRAAGEKEEA
jgi:hypothetical protein